MAERDERGRWVPGVSGNPAGKPKGTRTLVSDLYRILAELPTGDELEAMYEQLEIPHGIRDEISMAGDRQEAFARALVQRMMVGNWNALEQIFGRMEPKPVANTLSGPDGGPVQTVGVALGGNDANAAQAEYLALVRGENPTAQECTDDDDDAEF